ncbi:MAG: CoA transferase, partial [Pseudomonadota bacterium]|nr:CoA transferase [Pseudomonadota bacterium]
MGGVLEGIRILDFGRYIAGPFCGMLLADMGAEVIRIEKIDGSEDR